MDPQVTKGMMNLGFEWDQIQDSIDRRYGRAMAAYQELNPKWRTVPSHAIPLLPFPFLPQTSTAKGSIIRAESLPVPPPIIL